MASLGSLLPPHRRVVPGLLMAVGGPAVVVGALLPFRAGLGSATAGLAFVVPVVLATALGGAAASVVAVVVGFLAYNVLFTVPYYTLAVAHVPDVVGLLVYVLVGAVIAVIVSLRQQEASVARRRELEAMTVSDLARSLLVESEVDAVSHTVVSGVARIYPARTVALFHTNAPGDGFVLAALSGQDLPDEVQATLTTDGSSGPWSPRLRRVDDLHVLPLMASGAIHGVLVVWGQLPPAGERVLTVFANQAALALHRAELVRATTRLRVLEESDRVRSALIRSVSHDLRTPLSSITAAAEDLADAALPLGEEDRALLAATIVEEAERLDHLVANLLDMSRLESGQLKLRREAVEVIDLVHAACSGNRIEGLTSELPVDLPPLYVDPVLVEQVLRNLLQNARRFSPAPGSITVTARRCDEGIEIAVADRGPGVRPEDRERVFELFRHIEADGVPGGTGVGLAICRGYVEAHGGRIWVEDTPGGGATFVVVLPTAALPDELAAPPRAEVTS